MINIKPFLCSVNFRIVSENPRFVILGTSNGNLLKVATILPLCLNALTLNLLNPGIPIVESIALPFLALVIDHL